MAGTMTSRGEGARALRTHTASPARPSRVRLAPSDKSDGTQRVLRNEDWCHFQTSSCVSLFPWKLLDVVLLSFVCCDITDISSVFPVATAPS